VMCRAGLHAHLVAAHFHPGGIEAWSAARGAGTEQEGVHEKARQYFPPWGAEGATRSRGGVAFCLTRGAMDHSKVRSCRQRRVAPPLRQPTVATISRRQYRLAWLGPAPTPRGDVGVTRIGNGVWTKQGQRSWWALARAETLFQGASIALSATANTAVVAGVSL